MGYFIYFIWKWVTEEIDPIIGETMGTLIKLVDRVRMLDNDMIRMNTKLAMVLEHKVLLDTQLDNEQKEEILSRAAEAISAINDYAKWLKELKTLKKLCMIVSNQD
jgi:hypothetical protein